MRLITGGCSCTLYCWPTWADYLGRHYDEYINTAHSGADNSTIARNIIDTAKAGDTVVIQWTGFDRFNTFDDHAEHTYNFSEQYNAELLMLSQCGMVGKKPKGKWNYSGTVFSNPVFLKHCYSPIERFRNTLDAVRSVVMHSKLVGYNLWNFTMCDWFLGEIETTVDSRLVKMHEREQFSHFYMKSNCLAIRDLSGYNKNVSHKYSDNDSHPQPWPQWIWLRDHIAPEIGVKLDLTLEQQVKLDQQHVLAGDVK
jgi:hypothetical protein